MMLLEVGKTNNQPGRRACCVFIRFASSSRLALAGHLWLLHGFHIFTIFPFSSADLSNSGHSLVYGEQVLFVLQLRNRLAMAVSMEVGQLVLTRPDSPVILQITSTTHNPSQSTSSGHLIVTSTNGTVQQFSVSKPMNCNEINKSRICRDFVRGSCRRLYCKYPHVQSSDLVVFCHDYQNNKCPRINCK
jgi:hypothetical protein